LLIFIKKSNPNEGNERIDHKWISYLDNNSYIKINSDLTKTDLNSSDYIGNDIRSDLYEMFGELAREKNCKVKEYQSKHHTSGKWPQMDKCLEKLEESSEYIHLTEMFLIEYEKCMSNVESQSSLRNFYGTICLDAIAIRRLLIEYDICCNQNDTSVNSTICSYNNFDKKYLKYDLSMLINFTKKMANIGISNQRNIDTQSISNPLSLIKILYLNIIMILIACFSSEIL
jgi:hypothetical protein